MTSHNYFSFFFLSFFILNGVILQAQVQTKKGKVYEMTPAKIAEEKIQILHMRMINVDGIETIELLNSKVVPGHLKEEFKCSIGRPHLDNKDHAHSRKELVCSILDESKNKTGDHIIDYPLRSHYEYPLSESSGQMRSIAIEQDEKDFFIRIPNNNKSKYLKLLMIDAESKNSISEFEF